jgi:DNA (cytosine-5)-methyltransferase 1
VPFRFESVARLAQRDDLRSLIVPVEAGLRKFREIADDMAASASGAFLILRADSGSGKSTLLHTLDLFFKDVATVIVKRDEPIREALHALGPFGGTLRVVVIENREAPGDTTEVEIESAILGINAFLRSDAGTTTAVVWPCNSDPMAEKLIASALQIGGEALLGVGEPMFPYGGPDRDQYLLIAQQTIATFNFGASLANLGISEQRAIQLANQAATIGAFLRSLQVEERKNREALASRLEAQDQCRMWVVVIAKNDPEPDVGVLTRGSYSTADIDRLVKATEANVVQEIKQNPEKLGLLGVAFDAKILHVPALTAIEVVQEFADPSLRAAFTNAGFNSSGSTSGRERLLDSDLAAALQGEPVGPLGRGRKPGPDRLRPFDALMAVSKTDDVALNRALGTALVACGLIERFDLEVNFGEGLTRRTDIVCDPHLDPVRLELMWRSDTSRAEIANYVLTKLNNYGRAIGFL